MKIIIRDGNDIKRCFVQVRDVNYLKERFNSEKIRKLALGNAQYRDLREDDFFEVKNMGVARLIDENPYIVDFSDVERYDSFTISRMILATQTFLASGGRKMDEEHKVLDLRDIISFKNGMLTYQIPVLYDGKELIDDGKIVFGSTTLPDYYMLRSYDSNLDLINYLDTNSNDLFRSINSEDEMKSYDAIKMGNEVLVHFNIKKNIIAKIKKRIAG